MNNPPELSDWTDAIESGLRPLRADALDESPLSEDERIELKATLSVEFEDWQSDEPEIGQPQEWQKFNVYLDSRWTNSDFTEGETLKARGVARKYGSKFENLGMRPPFLKHLLRDVSRETRIQAQLILVKRSPVAEGIRSDRKTLAGDIRKCVKMAERALLGASFRRVREGDYEVWNATPLPPQTLDDLAVSIEALIESVPSSEQNAEELLRRLRRDSRFQRDPGDAQPGSWTLGKTAPYLRRLLHTLVMMNELAKLLDGSPLQERRRREAWPDFARRVDRELRGVGIALELCDLGKLISLAFRRQCDPKNDSIRRVLKKSPDLTSAPPAAC